MKSQLRLRGQGEQEGEEGQMPTDLKLGDGLALVVLIRRSSRRLSPNDGKLHVLDLDADEEKVDLADDDVFQVISTPHNQTIHKKEKQVCQDGADNSLLGIAVKGRVRQ
jgi:hypothetical protein